MICSVLSTVVYCAGLRFAMTSWISRTVDGPRLQRTVRISSSLSVGLGSIYEDITTKTFVCQLQSLLASLSQLENVAASQLLYRRRSQSRHDIALSLPRWASSGLYEPNQGAELLRRRNPS